MAQKIMGNIFRTDEMVQRYAECQESEFFKNNCVICTKLPIQEFKYWRIAKNDFPYDRIAKVHDMIFPIRHTTEDGLTDEERNELLEIKKQLVQDYDHIIEASEKLRSVPSHHHLHLIVSKVV